VNEALEHQLAGLGLLLHLNKQARIAANIRQLGFVVVNETRQLIPYRQSALWTVSQGVSAVSGLPAPEHNTPYGQWLNLVCLHFSARLLEEEFLALCAEDLPLDLARDWSDWLPEFALLLPWRDSSNALLAVWLLARDEPWQEGDIALLRELSGAYAHAWKAFKPRENWRQLARRWIGGRRRKQRLALALLAACFFPVRLTVLAPAEVVPQDAFFVRAPLDGVVDRFHVQPNQPVKSNQPLFDLDTTGLRTRLGVARKAYEAATEEYRQSAQLAVTDDDKSRLEMSQRKSRMQEKEEEFTYSAQLMERVQVKATSSGVAVFADTSDWIGKAVSIGERVMQIADPNKVEVSIRLPVADAIQLPSDAKVVLYLTTSPQYTYAANLTYAAYQAEPGPDGLVAYKLRASFTKDETSPRLGLTGTAKIYGSWVPFSYYLLRHPLAVVRQWLGW
jgi:Barrel-sandwich domain of CusB or HlyD membrane-fusion